jgi:hypothetical protein
VARVVVIGNAAGGKSTLTRLTSVDEIDAFVRTL